METLSELVRIPLAPADAPPQPLLHASSPTRKGDKGKPLSAVSVRAVAVDSHNSIYCAFSTGRVKIWICVPIKQAQGLHASASASASPLTKESHTFQFLQDLDLPAADPILSLVVSTDCRRLFIGSGGTVVLFISSSSTSSNGTRRGKTRFVEASRFASSSSRLNCVMVFAERFLLTGAQEGQVSLWSVGNKDAPICSCFMSSPVFCGSVISDLSNVQQADGALEENGGISAAVLFGTSNG